MVKSEIKTRKQISTFGTNFRFCHFHRNLIIEKQMLILPLVIVANLLDLIFLDLKKFILNSKTQQHSLKKRDIYKNLHAFCFCD